MSREAISGTAVAENVDDVLARFADFGSWVSSLNIDLVESPGLRQMLKGHGQMSSQVALFESRVLAAIDAFGSDSVGVQKSAANTSHRRAKKKASTAKSLTRMPTVQTKMAAGAGMSAGKAELLAGAADKTSPEAVDEDGELLDRVEKQDEDTARKTIDRWVSRKQSNEEKRTRRQRLIDERQFTMFLKDGKLHIHGSGDAVSDMKLFRRWEAEKDRLYRLDGGREEARKSGRTDEQRGYDAWVNCMKGIDGVVESDSSDRTPDPAPRRAKTPLRHQMIVSAPSQTIDGTDPDAMADVIGGGPLLRSELERLMCNSELFGLLYDPANGDPLWMGRSVRTVTDAQWRALLVRDGGCVLTGADPSRCEGHHLKPFEAPIKGQTNIDELVMLATDVHTWLHANKLTLYQDDEGEWKTRPATKDEIAPSRPTKDPPRRRSRPEKRAPEQGTTTPPATNQDEKFVFSSELPFE
ncbi:MAG: DUF222 domain-containing protein [Acidimicrobiales bacterium]|nr:DUF222 domain-containing protein [Acidimicrobiales bacterium]